MNYNKIYCSLILKALRRQTMPNKANLVFETHHILPKSMGGQDDASNLVRLTIKEHLLAHLLLYKMGNTTQIFSVECILADATNKTRALRYKHPALRSRKWVLRILARQRAATKRELGKAKALKRNQLNT